VRSAQIVPAGTVVPAGSVVPVRNIMLAFRSAPAAGVAAPIGDVAAQEEQGKAVPEVPSLDNAGSSSSPTIATTTDLASATMKPIELSADPETDRLVTEAWKLIERGDNDAGRSKLLKAREHDRTDPRADFSLALLDGMVNGDWASAAKRLSDCLRRNPDNVPLLNDLAVAQMHSHRDADAAKHWKTIVSQHAATVEVMRNLGRARYLIKLEDSRKSAAVLKTLDGLCSDAAVGTSLSSKPEPGFCIMGLLLADGRTLGWSNPRRMFDTSPLTSSSANPSSRATASGPGAANGAKPGTGVPVSNDPRAWQAGAVQPGAYRPGAAGYQPQTPNGPASARYGRIRF
jgi:Flp pilus assembly protein TadD